MTASSSHTPGRGWAVAGWLLTVVVALVFTGLGRWQLGRMHEKTAMLASLQQVLQKRDQGHVASLASAADAESARDYDWAAGTGRFASTPPLLLDNQVRDGRPGVRVYRAFLPDAGASLLVELGWLPLDAQRRVPVQAVAMPDAGAIRIAGLLMPPPSSGLAVGDAMRLQKGVWWMTRLDMPAVQQALGSAAGGTLAPRVLRLDPRSPLGFARDLDILPNTLPPQRHLGYAVQWFALAAAVLCTAAVVTLTRRKRRLRHD